jgi:hypothetical protein
MTKGRNIDTHGATGVQNGRMRFKLSELIVNFGFDQPRLRSVRSDVAYPLASASRSNLALDRYQT